jgi:enoyl-[acyl-carrier protein] reductase I
MANNLLAGKKGIIFGALNKDSIAWKVAEKAHEEGAEFILTNAPVAMRMGSMDELAAKTNSETIAVDATSSEDLDKLFEMATAKYGKIDFILHSIGMSVNVRKGIHYTESNHDYYMKAMDVSAVSFHKVMKVALEKDVMNVFPDYNDMADAKTLLESIARNFGYHFGARKKVRVNTISQSPTPTTAGSGVKGFDAFIRYAEDNSPLGNASADACADYCVSLFSDLTKYVTMQNLFHDGGFSYTGLSHEVMDKYKD